MSAIQPAIRSALQPAIRSAILSYGAVAWSPLTLFAASEVGVWYDPSDFSTMFQDSAGTTPVTAIGDPVGKILDKSGNGKHASQATAASRPILRHDGTNYYLEFDGVDDSLATAAVNFTATDEITVFAGVMKITGGGLYGVVVEASANYGSFNGAFFLDAPDTVGTYGAAAKGTVSATLVTAASYPAGTANVLTAGYDISADSISIRVNGASPATSSANLGTGNFGNHVLYFGRRNEFTLPLKASVYSMIILGRTATAAEITAAESYAAGKCGVTL